MYTLYRATFIVNLDETKYLGRFDSDNDASSYMVKHKLNDYMIDRLCYFELDNDFYTLENIKIINVDVDDLHKPMIIY